LRAFPDNGPKLVLAVPLSMSYGPSRRLFTKMAAEESATIVLTGRSEDQTLTNEIFRMWNELQGSSDKYGAGGVGSVKPATGTVTVTLDSKVALEGEELEAHLEAERLVKEKELAHKAAQERSKRMLEADDLEDSDSDDEEDDDEAEVTGADMALDKIGTDSLERAEGKGGQISTSGIPGAGNAFMESDDFRTASFDIYVKGQQMRATSFFGGGRAGPSAGQTRFRMFPFVERKVRKVDVYGETLDVGAWIRKGREIEEEVESPEVREAKRRKKEEDEKQVCRLIDKRHRRLTRVFVAERAPRATIKVYQRRNSSRLEVQHLLRRYGGFTRRTCDQDDHPIPQSPSSGELFLL
jgi:cleavage and polyadenylation specificity factor subunit 2